MIDTVTIDVWLSPQKSPFLRGIFNKTNLILHRKNVEPELDLIL